MADEPAAREAGYSDSYARQASVRIRPQAEAKGLVKTADIAALVLRIMHEELAVEEELRKMFRVQMARAQAGDMSAIREILDRLIGKPVQAHQLEGSDGGPIELLLRHVNDWRNPDA